MTRRPRLDVPALYQALDERRWQRGITWAQVSEETGLAAPTFTRLHNARPVSADNLYALLSWLGKPIYYAEVQE